MKTTDFSKVAEVYDNNSFRFDELAFDIHLEGYIHGQPQQHYNVMDLACGTGIYLDHQMGHFDAHSIEWHGVDASEAMLGKAREKLKRGNLVQGLAEDLPYVSNSFDFIINNYAFHHFTRKSQVLDEVYRVLKDGGIFKIHNINVHDMENWWIYQYFPSAYTEDLERFWQKQRIFRELEDRGFKVRLETNDQMEKLKVTDYLQLAENRDISVLTIISDDDYYAGLSKMKNDLEHNPAKTMMSDFSELVCIAEK